MVIDGTKVIAISMKKIPFLAIVVGVPSSIIAEGLVYVSTSKCPHSLYFSHGIHLGHFSNYGIH